MTFWNWTFVIIDVGRQRSDNLRGIRAGLGGKWDAGLGSDDASEKNG